MLIRIKCYLEKGTTIFHLQHTSNAARLIFSSGYEYSCNLNKTFQIDFENRSTVDWCKRALWN